MATDDADSFPVWTEERIRNPDTDQYGHVNNAAIATYCEAGRIALFDAPGIADAMTGLSIVVAKLTITFGRELFYPGAVRIGTGIAGLGTTSFRVSQALFGPEGRFATSEATCVVFDVARRASAPIPATVRAVFEGWLRGEAG